MPIPDTQMIILCETGKSTFVADEEKWVARVDSHSADLSQYMVLMRGVRSIEEGLLKDLDYEASRRNMRLCRE